MLRKIAVVALVVASSANIALADEIILSPPTQVGAGQQIYIGQPGNYRLANGFSVVTTGPNATPTAITIASPNVTLDLGKNVIDGGARCSPNVTVGNNCTTTTVTSGLIQIAASGPVKLMNGTVMGGQGDCISISYGANFGPIDLSDLVVANCRNNGVNAQYGYVQLTNITSYLNGNAGLNLNGQDNLVQNSRAYQNNGDGIYVNGLRGSISNSVSRKNAGNGAQMPLGGVVDKFIAADNWKSGVFAAGHVTNSDASGNHLYGFEQVKFVQDSQATSNTAGGMYVSSGAQGCYAALRVSGNGTPQISTNAVALAGAVGACQ